MNLYLLIYNTRKVKFLFSWVDPLFVKTLSPKVISVSVISNLSHRDILKSPCHGARWL